MRRWIALSLIAGSPRSDSSAPSARAPRGERRLTPRSPALPPPAPAALGSSATVAAASPRLASLPLPRAAAPRWDEAASDALAARVPLHLPLLPPPPPPTRALYRKSPLGGRRAVKSFALLPPLSVTRASRRLLFLSLGQVGVLLTGSAGHKMGLPLPWAPPFCEEPPRWLRPQPQYRRQRRSGRGAAAGVCLMVE